MRKIKAHVGQSVLDIALLACGTTEALLQLLDNNKGLSIESNLHGGEFLLVEEEEGVMGKYLRDSGKIPATAVEHDSPYYNGEFESSDFNGDFY
jgi:hypothetical protein